MSQSTPESTSSPNFSETPAEETINMSDISRPEGMKYTAEEFLQILKKKFPKLFVNQEVPPELQKYMTRENGMIRIDIPRGETATFPDGTRIESDGSIVKPSGLRTRPVMENNQFTGRVRIFKPDGTELEPGEAYTDTDGSVTIMQK